MVNIESVPQESYIDEASYEADRSRPKKIGEKVVAGLFRLKLIGERLRRFAPKDMDPAGVEVSALCEPQEDEWFRRRGRKLVELTIAWPNVGEELAGFKLVGYVDATGVFVPALPEVVDGSEEDSPVEAVEGYFVPNDDQGDPGPLEAQADQGAERALAEVEFQEGLAALLDEMSVRR